MKIQYLQQTFAIHKNGLINTLILIVIGVIFLSIIGFDIRAAVEDEQTQANFAYLIDIFKNLYERYLGDIGAGVWRIFEPILTVLYDAIIKFDWADVNANVLEVPGIE